MFMDRSERQREFDPGETERVTRVGLFLRKAKVNELPELFNVLNGDMSIVVALGQTLCCRSLF